MNAATICLLTCAASANQLAFERLARRTPSVVATVPPQGDNAGGSAGNLVNRSGINAEGLSDDSYTGWHSDGSDPSLQWVKLDLGRVVPLETLKVWNYNFTWKKPDGARQPYANRGVKDADLYLSDADADPGADFADWTFLKTITLTKATPFESNPPDVIDLNGARARWLAIDIRSSYTDDDPEGENRFVGLNEIEIIVPDADAETRPAPVAPVVESTSATDLATVGARLGGESRCRQ